MTLIVTVAVAVALAVGRKEEARSTAGGEEETDEAEAMTKRSGPTMMRSIVQCVGYG